ncbi:MAG: PAS domain S-box protein, partial [Bacteroidota bacterium]|nr:PAS domain S-box protein [Bacteroidota bacterium]
MSANSSFFSINVLDSAKQLLKVAEQLAPEQAMILICEPNGRILTFNDSARKILNHPASKINQLSDLVPAEDQLSFFSALKELSSKNRITFPLTDISPSGFVIMMNCSYLEADNTTFLCCMLTEELLAKQAIPVRTLSEDDYKAIFDNSLEYICILDQESNIIDLNKAALRFSAYSKEDLVGRSIGDILEFNDFELSIFLRRLKHALSGNEQKFDWWFKDKDQELVTVEIILRPATYLGQKAVIARAIDAYKQISSEKNVRFRNRQLEFVNSLLTHLAKFKTSEEILHFTLDQLLEKTDIIGGAIYLYQSETHQLNLLNACGTNSDLIKQYPQLEISQAPEGKFTKKNVYKLLKSLEQDLKDTLPVKPMAIMPVCSERSFVAVFVLFLHNNRKVTSSFTALIESIGNGISQYITKHELNRQLNYSESKYQILFDSSSDAIILSDECQIIDCNRAVQAITGISKDKILKTDLISLLSHSRPEEEHKIRPLLQKALEKGKQITFAWRPAPTDSVFLETDVSFNRLLIDGKFYIQTIIRDVTQKKQALAARRKEEVLTESINQFRDLISKVEMAYV